MPSKQRKKNKNKNKENGLLLKPRKIKIKVVGIGGGGTSIVSEMAQNLRGVSFVVADTDARVFKKAQKGVRVFQFGEKIMGGMGTGMNPDIAQKAALEEKDKIAKIFKDQDLSILIGALGGGVASGASPVFAEVARNQKNVALGIFTLPFSFEGEKKMRIARKFLEKIRENLSGTIVVPNEKIFQLIDKKTPLKKALSALTRNFAVWLDDLITIIAKPGLINIDFADLKTILNEQGNLLFFSQAVSYGPNRAEEVIKKIFQDPLFEGEPKGVKRILFNIAGDKDLGLKEVEGVSQNIARLNPRAKIIFGVSEVPRYKGKIKVTLLAVSDGAKKFSPSSVSDKDSADNKPEGGETEKSSDSVLGQPREERRSAKAEEKKNRQKESVVSKEKATKVATKEASSSDKKESEALIRREKTRRSALEVKKAEEEKEEREWKPDSEWEIPTFLREKTK